MLFHLSSCQKVNSENWGRLYSFMIAEIPILPEVSLKNITQLKNELREFVKLKAGPL